MPRSREKADVADVLHCLYSMIWRMSETFFSRLSNLEQFEQKPDVVEEYFFLIGKVLQCCPAQFVAPANSNYANAVISGSFKKRVVTCIVKFVWY